MTATRCGRLCAVCERPARAAALAAASVAERAMNCRRLSVIELRSVRVADKIVQRLLERRLALEIRPPVLLECRADGWHHAGIPFAISLIAAARVCQLAFRDNAGCVGHHEVPQVSWRLDLLTCGLLVDHRADTATHRRDMSGLVEQQFERR